MSGGGGPGAGGPGGGRPGVGRPGGGGPGEGELLAGGHTAPVIRVGDTVRRCHGDVAPYNDVVRWAAVRLADLIDYSRSGAAAGDAGLQFTIDAGHVSLYEGDLRWVEALLADAAN